MQGLSTRHSSLALCSFAGDIESVRVRSHPSGRVRLREHPILRIVRGGRRGRIRCPDRRGHTDEPPGCVIVPSRDHPGWIGLRNATPPPIVARRRHKIRGIGDLSDTILRIVAVLREHFTRRGPSAF